MIGPKIFRFILCPSEANYRAVAKVRSCCIPVLKLVWKAVPVEILVVSLQLVTPNEFFI